MRAIIEGVSKHFETAIGVTMEDPVLFIDSNNRNDRIVDWRTGFVDRPTGAQAYTIYRDVVGAGLNDFESTKDNTIQENFGVCATVVLTAHRINETEAPELGTACSKSGFALTRDYGEDLNKVVQSVAYQLGRIFGAEDTVSDECGVRSHNDQTDDIMNPDFAIDGSDKTCVASVDFDTSPNPAFSGSVRKHFSISLLFSCLLFIFSSQL
jgi:hypothetical protein